MRQGRRHARHQHLHLRAGARPSPSASSRPSRIRATSAGPSSRAATTSSRSRRRSSRSIPAAPARSTRAITAAPSDYYNTPNVLPNMDDLNPHLADGVQKWTWQVTLPNVECDNCTLQVIQVMEDNLAHGDYDPTPGVGIEDIYHQCIDLVLKQGAPMSNDVDLGGTGGAAAAAAPAAPAAAAAAARAAPAAAAAASGARRAAARSPAPAAAAPWSLRPRRRASRILVAAVDARADSWLHCAHAPRARQRHRARVRIDRRSPTRRRSS